MNGKAYGLALAALFLAAPITPSTISAQVASPPLSEHLAPAEQIARGNLSTRIDQLGRSFDGHVGIAVRDVETGWTTSWNGEAFFPQQSVSKFWVAITAFQAVDAGQLDLDQRVTVRREDLTLFHQPIAAKVLGGGATMSLSQLMYEAITKSDNTANDKLMRSVGGPAAVRAMIAEKGLGAIRFYDGERALQSKIAGLIWTQSYSVGGAFYKARNALPLSVRQAAFNRYIDDPYDGASPRAIVDALARLKRGELLSPSSTQKLLSIMSNTKTGPQRLKGGLAPGWTLAHKTGTGQVLGGTQAGYNDIGVLTAPDGSAYAAGMSVFGNVIALPWLSTSFAVGR